MTTTNRSAIGALACGALLAGCAEQPEPGSTAPEPRSFAQVATAQGEVRGTTGDGLVAGSGSRPVNHGGNLATDGVQSRKDSWIARLDALNELAGM